MPGLSEIAERLKGAGIVPRTVNPAITKLGVGLLRILAATGRPVAPTEAAAQLGIPREWIDPTTLRMIELDADGNITGLAGLTVQPTRHELHLGSRSLHTWCAWDGLLLPVLLDAPARMQTPCRSTNTPIRVSVTATEVSAIEPEGAVLVMRVPEQGGLVDADAARTRSDFCSFANFYRSRDLATETDANQVILAVAEGHELARLALSDVLVALER